MVDDRGDGCEHLLQDEVEVEGEDAEVVQEVGQPAVAALAGGRHQVEPVLSRLHSCLIVIIIIVIMIIIIMIIIIIIIIIITTTTWVAKSRRMLRLKRWMGSRL